MFEFHKLNETGMNKVNDFKTKMSLLVSEVALEMGDSRDTSIFKTKIEEAVFFGTRALASKPLNFTERTTYPEIGPVAK